jgi:predicted ATPase/class 3 adenylate cyclase
VNVPAFLFTDIEGSTSRWERHGAAMADAVRRHDVLLRTAIESRGGMVFKTIGDAFCAVFDSAGPAIAAAVAAQRLMRDEPWDAVGGMSVRMAVHAGDAELRDGDFFGPPLNRVARMLDHGHGGQILVSAVAVEHIGTLEDGVWLRALGELTLRGTPEPERVFQVCAADLRDDFPALHALRATPSNFPLQPTQLIGRAADRAAIAGALGGGRLVTVDGPGGIGKTRVALAAASDVRAEYPDGAWFVDFAPLRDEELVPSAVLTTLRAGRPRAASAGDALVDVLRKRRTLLVFDNCEHVVDAAARTSSSLMAHCPHVATLATSRAPLRVNGEREYRLTSLDNESAAALFAERAAIVDPAFTLDDRTRPLAIELCRRLDGLPLAIELAAARMRVLSLEELLRRLELRALTSGVRDRDARQKTMHALIEWSYDLLALDERRTFRALSVFAGGFTLAAACELDGAGEWNTLDALSSLTEKSLLVADVGAGTQRYRLLESIREYARERLDGDGEAPAALERHARTFREFADRAYSEWDTDPGVDWLARYALELDNVRAALRWAFERSETVDDAALLAASAAPLFMRLSLLREGATWCERAMSSIAALSAPTAARLQYAASMLYHNLGADDSALRCARQAAERYEAAGDERGLTRALSQVAYESAACGQMDDARVAADRALELARASGEPRLLAATLQRCAMVSESTDLALTRSRYAEAIDLFRALGRDDEMARAMMWWADAEGVSGDPAAAVSIAAQALEFCPPDLLMFLTNGMAGWYVALGDREAALPLAHQSLRLAREAHHEVVELAATLYLAAIAEDDLALPRARTIGFIDAQLHRLQWTLAASDAAIAVRLRDQLRQTMGDAAYEKAVHEGASWNDERAAESAQQFF